MIDGGDGFTRDRVSIASQLRAAITRGPAAGPYDVACEGTLQRTNTAQGRFETRAEGSKTALVWVGCSNTPISRDRFFRRPDQAGRRLVSKRTCKASAHTLNVHIGEVLAQR